MSATALQKRSRRAKRPEWSTLWLLRTPRPPAHVGPSTTGAALNPYTTVASDVAHGTPSARSAALTPSTSFARALGPRNLPRVQWTFRSLQPPGH